MLAAQKNSFSGSEVGVRGVGVLMSNRIFSSSEERFVEIFGKEFSDDTRRAAASITFKLLDDLESCIWSTVKNEKSASGGSTEEVLLPAGTIVLVFNKTPMDFCNLFTCGFVVDEATDTVCAVSLFGSAQFDAWRRLRFVTPDREWKEDRAPDLHITCIEGGFSVSLVERPDVKVDVQVPLSDREFVDRVNSKEPITWFFDRIKKELEGMQE